MADDSVLNRLSIQVPDYDTRLNMGTPDPGAPSGSQPFGYTGFGVHTQYNFFVDVGRVGLYQSNLGSCWQVGGKWLQWSNNDMYMATLGNNTLAADNKVLIAAGAGQGQVTALTSTPNTWESPRLVEYNNLALHWRVDAVQVALKTFLYGADMWKDKGKETAAAQKNYRESDSAGSVAGNHYPGGFLKDVDTLLGSIDSQNVKSRLLRGFEWEGDRMDMQGKGSYFSALEPFDPYPPTPFADNFFSQAYAVIVQGLNWIHRTVDLARKIGSAVTDNWVGKRAQALIQAWQDSQDAINAVMGLTADFKQWSRPGGEFAVTESHWPWPAGGYPGTKYSSPLPATLKSTPGPWDVGTDSPVTLTVSDGLAMVQVVVTPKDGKVSVQQLAAAMAAAGGNWTITPDDTTVTITDNVAGAASRLDVSGPPAFFGAHAHADGTGEQVAVGFSNFEEIDNERSMQISFSSLPEDLRNHLRPLYQAASDFSSVLEKGVTAVGDVISSVTGVMSPPSMLGLIAKDGITLGTPAPMYATGGGITLVATGGGTDPDDRKFFPGVEKIVKKLLDGDDIAKSVIQNQLVPESDLKNNVLPGHFRVAAQQDVVVAAAGGAMHVALDDVLIASKKRVIVKASEDDVDIRSYSSNVRISGVYTCVGDFAETSKQKATKWLNLYTDKQTLSMGGGAEGGGPILLGGGPGVGDMRNNPHLAIDTTPGTGSFAGGYWDSSDFFGQEIKATGEIQTIGKTSVTVGVKDGAGLKIDSSAVTVSKAFKVGSALQVNGDGTFAFSPAAAAAMKKAQSDYDAKKSELSGKYSANLAKGTQAAGTLKKMRDQLNTAPNDEARSAIMESMVEPAGQLEDAYRTHTQLLSEAKSYGIDSKDIGWKQADDDVFERFWNPYADL